MDENSGPFTLNSEFMNITNYYELNKRIFLKIIGTKSQNCRV